MNNLQKCLSNNMKKFRKLRGLSQEKLAEKAGASGNYIALIESGKSFPSLPMISQIAGALKIDELELFNSTGLQYNEFSELHNDLLKQIKKVVDKKFEKLG